MSTQETTCQNRTCGLDQGRDNMLKRFCTVPSPQQRAWGAQQTCSPQLTVDHNHRHLPGVNTHQQTHIICRSAIFLQRFLCKMRPVPMQNPASSRLTIHRHDPCSGNKVTSSDRVLTRGSSNSHCRGLCCSDKARESGTQEWCCVTQRKEVRSRPKLGIRLLPTVQLKVTDSLATSTQQS
jgi:hypothetical protein